MRYQYKVIPFIGQAKGSLSASDVAKQLEMAISQHVVRGWEFYQLSDVNIEVQPGCLAGLFGAKAQYMRFDQLIFRASEGSVQSSLRDSAETENGPAATSTQTAPPANANMWRCSSCGSTNPWNLARCPECRAWRSS